MWFRNCVGLSNRAADARRLFLEGLEDRRLMAFNVLAEYATTPYPQDLALAQIDADGPLDLVTIENGRVAVRPGNADGSFDPPLSIGDINASHAVTGDFTDDGVSDLVTELSGQLSLRIGNGNGTFQTPQPLPVPGQSVIDITGVPQFYGQFLNSLATGDLNADGKLDLVVGGGASFRSGISCGYYSCGYIYSTMGFVNVLMGNGAGSFNYADDDPTTAELNAHSLGTDQVPSSLAIEDLNHDGRRDVVASKYYGGFATLLGDGAGDLQSPIHSAWGSPLSSLSLGDVDGDGNLDTLSRSGNNLVVQKGQGDGSFAQGAIEETGQRLQSAVMGDVNADGKLDLVAVGTALCNNYGYYGGCYDPTNAKQASVLLGNGQGTFSLPIASSLGTATDFYSSFVDAALADLTGDGLPELVTIDRRSGGGAIIAANDGNWIAPVELSITDVTVVEGNSGSINAVFTVTRSRDAGTPVSVAFTTADYYAYPLLYAAAGADYTPQAGTLTFEPGVLSQTITVPVLGDQLGEGSEGFSINLYNANGAVLRDAQGVATIVDDEPGISIDHAYGVDPLTVVEGDVGTKPAVFTVSLTRPYDQEVTVDYNTYTGNTSDIIEVPVSTLHFAPGVTSQTITVQIVGDLIDEPLEAFNVFLGNPSPNATFVNSAGYCYIEDNDPTPTVSISDVSKNEGNSGTTKFNFTLTLSAPTDGGWVEFATANGTAAAGQDYTAKSGYVYFNAGQLTQTISIDVKGDRTGEANETFYVNLISAGGATIADDQGVGTIVNDDGVIPPQPPKISIGDAQVAEGNSGTKQLVFTVSLSQSSSQEVRVNYATANDTAKTGNNDYESKSGTIRFAPGETTKTISITVNGDKKVERDERFKVKLFGAVNGEISDSQALGTILNDDSGVPKQPKGGSEKQPKTVPEKQPKTTPEKQAKAVDAVIDALWNSFLKNRGY